MQKSRKDVRVCANALNDELFLLQFVVWPGPSECLHYLGVVGEPLSSHKQSKSGRLRFRKRVSIPPVVQPFYIDRYSCSDMLQVGFCQTSIARAAHG